MGISSIDRPGSHPEPPTEATRQELVLQASDRSQAAHAVLVVGFDRRPESLAALATAAELGRRLAAELRVIHDQVRPASGSHHQRSDVGVPLPPLARFRRGLR